MKTFLHLCLILFSTSILAQNNPPIGAPQTKSETNFECDVVLDIYDAFVDWKSSPPQFWGGKNTPKNAVDKIMVGAVCVANKNDTNGNGIPDNDENNVTNSNHRNEIDLMNLVLRPREIVSTLTGTVTLSKESGNNIKIWTTPEKLIGTQITLPLTIQASSLPKTWYIEATEPSNNVRDIEISATYQGKKDKVKATSVWMTLEETYDNAADNPDLKAIGVESCIRGAIEEKISSDGSNFGFGSFMYKGIEKLGGRILFQWKLLPTDANNIIVVDGTRQRSTKNWALNMDVSGSLGCKFDLTTVPFPFENNQDIEMPNDDSSKPNNEFCVDHINENGVLFTYDAPSVVTNQEFLHNSVFPLWQAFDDSKSNFYEFVRIGPKGTNFDPSFQGLGMLIGSRGSDKVPWSNAYYTKKNNEFKLASDNTLQALNHIRIGDLKDDHDIYPIQYSINSLNTTYELGNYNAVIIRNASQQIIFLTRFGEDVDGNCTTLINEQYDLPISLNPPIYDLPFMQHGVHITENQPQESIFLNWHTYQSPNKLNILNGNAHITNFNH